MADNTHNSEFRYTITLSYLNTKKNTAYNIKDECIKNIIIDHNFESNCMPIIYADMNLDKALIDDMITNINDNLIILELNKYDNATDLKLQIQCFRKKFIYFLPDSVSKTDKLDYNEKTEDTLKGDSYKQVVLGLLDIEAINANKTKCELTAKNINMYDIVKYITSHINNIIIEPFYYNESLEQFNLKPTNSVNKALNYLNNYRVFYSTPYRYYNDFNYTYIISSSGRGIPKNDELYNSIIISVKDILDENANSIGMITNKSKKTYQVNVSYGNVSIFDNSLSNKSVTSINGISTEGTKTANLSNTASYSNTKIESVRLNNDNIHMIENIQSAKNMNNFFVHLDKNNLDTDLFTINKRITINNIDKYQDYNGEYILYRKQESFTREDKTFIMLSMLDLKRIDHV